MESKLEPNVDDHVNYHGCQATVLNKGWRGAKRVLWLRSDVDRGSLRVGSEFECGLSSVSDFARGKS